MFLWSPNAQPNTQLKFRLALSVLAMHLLLIGAYIFFSRPKPVIIKISRSFNRNYVAVRVIPFLRQTGQLQRALQAQNSSKRTVAPPAASIKRLTRQVYKKPVAQASKTQVKKLVKQQTRTSKKSKKSGKNKKTQASAPIQLPIQEQKQTQQTQPIETTQENSPEPIIENTGPLDIAITNTSEEIVLGTEEYDALQAYQLIQSEMGTHWHPPAGFLPKHACIILITLNNKGTVTHMQVEQSSGILAYDMAARMAINRTMFPKGVWNQLVRLHF